MMNLSTDVKNGLKTKIGGFDNGKVSKEAS